MAKQTLPVKLRKKATKNGFSLYLEFNHNGRTEKKYLGLHLINGTTAKAKAYNTNIMEQAKAEQAKAVLEVTATTEKGIAKAKKMTLTELCAEYLNEKKRTGKAESTTNLLQDTFAHIANFTDHRKYYVSNIDVKFCEDFIVYLKSAKSLYKKEGRENKLLAPSTAQKHLANFVGMLNYAVRKNIIVCNPFEKVGNDYHIKAKNAERGYLDVNELKAVENSRCANEEVKRAFLFSCYCGLRISDIRTLCKDDVKEINGKKHICKVMIKTGETINIPLNSKAMHYLGEATKNGKFFNLPQVYAITYNVNQLAENANISKHITFHVARHTFATTLLTLGGDIYTTSKLLGHKKVTTTQIYADIVNKKKEEAVNLFDNI